MIKPKKVKKPSRKAVAFKPHIRSKPTFTELPQVKVVIPFPLPKHFKTKKSRYFNYDERD